MYRMGEEIRRGTSNQLGALAPSQTVVSRFHGPRPIAIGNEILDTHFDGQDEQGESRMTSMDGPSAASDGAGPVGKALLVRALVGVLWVFSGHRACVQRKLCSVLQ